MIDLSGIPITLDTVGQTLASFMQLGWFQSGIVLFLGLLAVEEIFVGLLRGWVVLFFSEHRTNRIFDLQGHARWVDDSGMRSELHAAGFKPRGNAVSHEYWAKTDAKGNEIAKQRVERYRWND